MKGLTEEASPALDAPAIEQALSEMAQAILSAHPDLGRIALVGIPSRGVPIAQRLAEKLRALSGQEVEHGVIDVSMHRDDLATRFHPVELTRLPESLEEKTIILTDDVLFSGRTCRAAMDALSSFGRPARIQLAVLIDRGHRELPIHADFVGRVLPTAAAQRVFVRLEAVDGVPDGVWLEQV